MGYINVVNKITVSLADPCLVYIYAHMNVLHVSRACGSARHNQITKCVQTELGYIFTFQRAEMTLVSVINGP